MTRKNEKSRKKFEKKVVGKPDIVKTADIFPREEIPVDSPRPSWGAWNPASWPASLMAAGITRRTVTRVVIGVGCLAVLYVLIDCESKETQT